MKILVFSSFYDGYEKLTITLLWLDLILGVHTFILCIGCKIAINGFSLCNDSRFIINEFLCIKCRDYYVTKNKYELPIMFYNITIFTCCIFVQHISCINLKLKVFTNF